MTPRNIVISSFFAVACIMIGVGAVQKLRGDPNARKLTDSLYSFISEDVRGLERAKIQREMAAVNLEIAKIQDTQAAIPFWRKVKAGGVLAVLATLCTSGVVVSLVFYYRKTVFTVRIGKHSEVKVRYKDLASVGMVANGLVLAEQLKAHADTQAKAFDMTLQLSEVVTHQLKAIGAKTERLALPEMAQAMDAPTVITQRAIPTFADLLQDGMIGAGRPLVFGYADGDALTGTWQDLFSCAVGGRAGSGKTSTLRSLICQSALQGCRFHLIDPHNPHKDSLQASLTPLIQAGRVSAELPINELKAVNRIITARLKGAEPCDQPVVLVIDELLSVMPKLQGTAETLLRIGTEGRKVKVYGLFAGHSWQAGRTGGDTAIRDNLTALFVHNMKKRQAQILTQDADVSRQVAGLRTGQAIFAPVNADPQVVTIPHCTTKDVKTVARLLSETHRNAQEAVRDADAMQEAESITVNVERPVDLPVEQTSQHVEPGKVNTVDLSDENVIRRVKMLLSQKNTEGQPVMTQGRLATLSGVDKGLLSKVLNGKEALTTNVKDKLLAALQRVDPASQPAETAPVLMQQPAFIQ